MGNVHSGSPKRHPDQLVVHGGFNAFQHEEFANVRPLQIQFPPGEVQHLRADRIVLHTVLPPAAQEAATNVLETSGSAPAVENRAEDRSTHPGWDERRKSGEDKLEPEHPNAGEEVDLPALKPPAQKTIDGFCGGRERDCIAGAQPASLDNLAVDGALRWPHGSSRPLRVRPIRMPRSGHQPDAGGG